MLDLESARLHGGLMLEVRYRNGVELPEHALWLDPHEAKPLAFVSHAHADHLARHQEVILTPETAILMRARLGGKRLMHPVRYGESLERNGLRLTLLSAGHISGSAQIYIESDRGSLLYTGDFKLRAGLSTEACQWMGAETLIMETTFGLPKYTLPPTEETLAAIVMFCRETLDAGSTPVLFAYSLGKAQEICWVLLKNGLIPVLPPAAYRMTSLCSELNPGFPQGFLPLSQPRPSNGVLVMPRGRKTWAALREVHPRRTAVLTGWALDSNAKYRYQCDAAFPLSDHADYPDLLRYVELVKPKRVLTLHGFASAFAADLRARGMEAWALSENDQLHLSL